MISTKNNSTMTTATTRTVGGKNSEVSKLVPAGCIMAGFASFDAAVEGQNPLETVIGDNAYFKMDNVSKGQGFFSTPFDKTDFEQVSLPHYKKDNKLNNDGSKALFYAVEFDFDGNKIGYNSVIAFEGIFGVVDVYINDDLVQTIDDAYYTTEVLITDYVKRGKNILGLKIYKSDHQVIDRLTEGYLGIYRNIILSYKSIASINDIVVTTEKQESDGVVTADIIYSSYEKEDLQYGGEIVLCVLQNGKTVAKKTVEFKAANKFSYSCERITVLVEDAQMWSVSSPKIYRLVVSLKPKHQAVSDVKALNFGFSNYKTKEIVQNNKKCLMTIHNDKRFVFKGGYFNHSENFECDVNATVNVLRNLKENEFNSIIIDNVSELLLTICDHIGMSVVVRIPLTVPALSGKKRSLTDKSTQQSLKRAAVAVTQFKNHPSVSGWLVDSENEFFHATLGNMVKTIDNSRIMIIKNDLSLGVSDVVAVGTIKQSELSRYAERKSVNISKAGGRFKSSSWISYFPLFILNFSKQDIVQNFEKITGAYNLSGGFIEALPFNDSDMKICKKAFSMMMNSAPQVEKSKKIKRPNEELSVIERVKIFFNINTSKNTEPLKMKTADEIEPDQKDKNKQEFKSDITDLSQLDEAEKDKQPNQDNSQQLSQDTLQSNVDEGTAKDENDMRIQLVQEIEIKNKPIQDIVETIEQANGPEKSVEPKQQTTELQKEESLTYDTTEAGDIVETVE